MKKAAQGRSAEVAPKFVSRDMAIAKESLERDLRRGIGLDLGRGSERVESKLNPGMRLDVVVHTMSEGLRDAGMLCNKVLKIGQSIDPTDPLVGLKALVLLDAAGIRGRKIETLYRACGKSHPGDFKRHHENFFAIILAVRNQVPISYANGTKEKFLTVTDLKYMANDEKSTGGKFHVIDGSSEIQLADVLIAVKKMYPRLIFRGRNITAQSKSQPLNPDKPGAKMGSAITANGNDSH